MRQCYFSYHKKDEFRGELQEFQKRLKEEGYSGMFFQIMSPYQDASEMCQVSGILEEIFPKVPWVGYSTSGNIVGCSLSEGITVAANIFEVQSTKLQIFQYDMNELPPAEIAQKILEETSNHPWVKAIEIFWTITDYSTSVFCEGLKELDEKIQVFGGIVCNPDITSKESYIASSEGSIGTNGVLTIFYGGPDFYIDSLKISGWKPIGRKFLVTKASGSRLYELGGVPAFEIYKKYLNIQNDNNFFYNALDFPMMYEHNQTTIVRAPSRSYEDGSLAMTSDVEAGEILRLSYGEPQTILNSIQKRTTRIRDFEPDVMHLFSCAARKAYWEPYEPTYELQSLKGICDTSGFFSHGEFIRENTYLNQHNITLVIASMREGEKKVARTRTAKEEQVSAGRLPLAARMATFIRETSYELEEINSTLESMNHQLEGLAMTDSLTGLKNRLSFNQLLQTFPRMDEKSNWIMLMMDVNGLKYTNDTFGHLAGDELIISAGKVIKKVFGKEGYCYRIGGDEFSVILDISDEELLEKKREFRDTIEEINNGSLYRLSIAVGKSKLKDNSNNYKSVSDWKMDADLNMYRDKTLIYRRAADNTEVHNHKELISCMIAIEEAKDPYTAHHSERVCAISEMIAKWLGLTENTVRNIRDAAHLHDIGKVGINDSILSKPSALTDTEFRIIKAHTNIGARILMQSNYTQELVQIVLHHHERYDGKGYPDKLSGADIPIGARIVALADSIDAMTSRRVYRNAMSLEECYREVERNLGKMYDPAIGKICLDHWAEIETVVKL